MLEDRVSRPDTANGFILDGYPRNLAQASAWATCSRASASRWTAPCSWTVDNELLIQRIAGRAKAEGRADDNPESVRKRLGIYTEQTAPVVEYYRQRAC
jgi:adenylate kinase